MPRCEKKWRDTPGHGKNIFIFSRTGFRRGFVSLKPWGPSLKNSIQMITSGVTFKKPSIHPRDEWRNVTPTEDLMRFTNSLLRSAENRLLDSFFKGSDCENGPSVEHVR